MSLTSEPVFNPLNPDHFGDAHKRMSIARKSCPVSEFVPGLVFVARDADVRSALKNTEVYSNVGNFELAGGSNPPVVTQIDPPRHTQMRSLMQTEIEGLKLSDDEIRMAIFQLIVAGSDSVTFLIGNLLYELLCQPELWRKVRDNQAFIPQAIEESLRHDPPISWIMRTCKHTTTIEQVEVEQGKRVVL